MIREKGLFFAVLVTIWKTKNGNASETLTLHSLPRFQPTTLRYFLFNESLQKRRQTLPILIIKLAPLQQILRADRTLSRSHTRSPEQSKFEPEGQGCPSSYEPLQQRWVVKHLSASEQQ